MKAALSADAKGHHVLLIEKANALGGQLNEDLHKFKEYLIHQIEKSYVEVMLSTCADRDLLESLQPDDVIVAIGADYITPPIKGVEQARQAVEAYETGLENIYGCNWWRNDWYRVGT